MSLASSFVKLGNHKMEEKSFCGKLPLAVGSFSGKDGDCFELCLDSPKSVNMLTLFESGENVTDFEIYVEKDGKNEMVYRQNRISDFRLCAIDEVQTQKISVKIVKTRKGKFKKVRMYAYCMEKKKTPFRTTAYIITDDYTKVDKSNMKYYNRFNLIGDIKMNADGSVVCDKEKFEGALNMVREHDPNADIVATFFANGDYVKVFKNKRTSSEIKKFLDKYDLNGASFDWEFPKNFYEWRVFDKFIVELKEKIGSKTITLALASWLNHTFSKKVLDCIDVAEVMTYDNMSRDIDGHHSEFFSDGPNAVHHFIKRGFDPSKIDLGLPFYARPVDGAGYWKDYKAEVDKMDKFTNVVGGEYRDLDWKKKEITVKPRFYNSYQMICDKTAFCAYSGVGGIMVWSLSGDAEESHPLCLSRAINKTLSERTEE